jgi:hypothetical protein
VARWTVFACLLASTAPASRAAERVEQILGKVEQSYRSAQSFHFVGSYHSGWRMHLDPAHEYRLAWDSVGIGRLRLSISSIRLKTIGLIDHSHRHAFGEVPFTDPHESRFRLIADGNVVWSEDRETHQYARAAYRDFTLDPTANEVYRLWIGRYQAIARQASQAHIAGRGKLRLQGRTANCVVIETGGPSAGSVHRYWVDEASYLIVRERVEIRSRSGKSGWSMVWQAAERDSSIPVEAFQFRPSGRARLTSVPTLSVAVDWPVEEVWR